MKNNAKFWVLTLLGAGVGFAVGLGIGKETSGQLSKNTQTSYDSGVVTVKLNVLQSVSSGVTSYFDNLLK